MELEVWPGARGPGDVGQEAEGLEAGGAGAGTSGLDAGGCFRGVLRGVEKVRVTLSSLEVSLPFKPQHQ